MTDPIVSMLSLQSLQSMKVTMASTPKLRAHLSTTKVFAMFLAIPTIARHCPAFFFDRLVSCKMCRCLTNLGPVISRHCLKCGVTLPGDCPDILEMDSSWLFSLSLLSRLCDILHSCQCISLYTSKYYVHIDYIDGTSIW